MKQVVKTRLKIMSVAVALAFSFSGCGGGSSDSAGATSTALADDVIDAKAAALVAQMTTQEKLDYVHGNGLCGYGASGTAGLSGPGFIPGIPRLGIPDLNMTDAGAGVADCSAPSKPKANAAATALPAPLALAASWDTQLAYDYGALVATQARAQGFNVLLGGSVGLTRDPRLGRAFEYMGEDPVLSALMVTPKINGAQAQHVLMSLKHYAANQQETSRNQTNSVVAERPLRELYLRHFEWAVRDAKPATVMCAYNQVNGDYACENKTLLNTILKGEWSFKGWVMSDWGATHSTAKSVNAGLDEEEMGSNFVDPLKKAVTVDGTVSMARLNDMVQRKLREMIAKGVIDNPPVKGAIDFVAGDAMAQKVAAQSMVLLKNAADLLPLAKTAATRIAVIGLHSDQGVLSGGGSSQVPTRGGVINTLRSGCTAANPGPGNWCEQWLKDSPLAAIKAKSPSSTVTFNDGSDIASATAAASADVVIVFAHQWATEGADIGTGLYKSFDDLGSNGLNLRGNQDSLIAAVAAAKPGKTVVVVQSGNPVAMPWIDQVSSVLEAWFPGEKGAEAIADLLFGDVNPSGKLPVTFPKNLSDFATGSTKLIEATGTAIPDITYAEGMLIGYRWYDTKNIEPLFPFGHGLSYTKFNYSDISVTADASSVSFTLSNVGKVAGSEVAQVYAELPSAVGDAKQRLIGFQKVELAPGATQKVNIVIPRERLMYWNTTSSAWAMASGVYTIKAGSSSRDIRLGGSASPK